MKKQKPTLEQQLAALEKTKASAENKSAVIRKQIEARDKAKAPKSILDRVSGMKDVMKILGASEAKDVIKIDKFDAAENEFIKNIIKKVRICKVYNEGKRLTKNDYRYYNWYDISSGFVFHDSLYVASIAAAASASRLCVDSSEKSKDIFKKFPEVENAIILE